MLRLQTLIRMSGLASPGVAASAAIAHQHTVGLASAAGASSPAGASTPTKYLISGYPECRFFQKAQRVGKAYEAKFASEVSVSIESYEYELFHEYRVKQLAKLGKKPDSHTTCPLVYTFELDGTGAVKPLEYVGGCDKTVALFKEKYGALPEAEGPLWK